MLTLSRRPNSPYSGQADADAEEEEKIAAQIRAGRVPDAHGAAQESLTPSPPAPPPAIQFPQGGLQHVSASYLSVELQHRDFSMTLFTLDVSIGEAQIALMLPAAMRVEHIKMKAKFTLVYSGQLYPVMYIGGNFTFQRSNPELRVLSFIRVAGSV